MDIQAVAQIFKELGHPTRLMIVKELVKYGTQGGSVGELQKILEIPHSTLSHHLSALVSVGLIIQERQGTTLRCKAQVGLIKQLTQFLLAECCIKENQE